MEGSGRPYGLGEAAMYPGPGNMEELQEALGTHRTAASSINGIAPRLASLVVMHRTPRRHGPMSVRAARVGFFDRIRALILEISSCGTVTSEGGIAVSQTLQHLSFAL